MASGAEQGSTGDLFHVSSVAPMYSATNKALCALEALENFHSLEADVTWTDFILGKRTRRDVVEDVLFSYLQSARGFGSSLKNDNDVHVSGYRWHHQKFREIHPFPFEIISIPARSSISSPKSVKEMCMLPFNAVITTKFLKLSLSHSMVDCLPSSSSLTSKSYPIKETTDASETQMVPQSSSSSPSSS